MPKKERPAVPCGPRWHAIKKSPSRDDPWMECGRMFKVDNSARPKGVSELGADSLLCGLCMKRLGLGTDRRGAISILDRSRVEKSRWVPEPTTGKGDL